MFEQHPTTVSKPPEDRSTTTTFKTFNKPPEKTVQTHLKPFQKPSKPRAPVCIHLWGALKRGYIICSDRSKEVDLTFSSRIGDEIKARQTNSKRHFSL
eukprot:935978-Heterocapsa_arctica.AAC.1